MKRKRLVIAFANFKGGVGKSTLACTIGDVLHRDGMRVMICDVDPQGTLGRWADAGAKAKHDAPPVTRIGGNALRRDLPRLSEGYDFVLIDCPPALGTETRAAIAEAHVVLVPLNPGPADVWALQETVVLIEEARAFRPELRAFGVMNRTNEKTSIAKGIREQAARLIPILDVHLATRVAYPEAMTQGQGVASYAAGSAAGLEAVALTRAVFDALPGSVAAPRPARGGLRVVGA